MNEEAREKIRSLIAELHEFVDVEWRWCRCSNECFDGFNLMLLKIQENKDLMADLEKSAVDDAAAKVFLDEIKGIVIFTLKQLAALNRYMGGRGTVRDWLDVLRGKLQFSDPKVQSSLARCLRSHYEGHFHLDQLITGSFFSTLPQSIQEVLDPDKNFPIAGLVVARKRDERRAAESKKVEIWEAKRKIRDFLRQNPYVSKEQFKQSLKRYDLNTLYSFRQMIYELPESLSEEIENVDQAICEVIADIIKTRQDEEDARHLEEQRKQKEAEKNRAQFELWQAKISGRCRQIVSLFNGIFDFAIDPDALLSGEINGEYASIHSVAPSGGGIGLHQELRQTLELRYCTGDEHTWLEIEAGGNETEWQATYDSENFLVWHELAHLADKKVIEQFVMSVVSARTDNSDNPRVKKIINDGSDTELFRKQAREVVIDAIAMRLGETFYVHSDKTRFVASGTGRKINMLKSYLVLANRILRSCDDGNQFLICRLLGIIAVSGELADIVKAVEGDEIVKTRIRYLCDWFRSNRLVEFYSSLYRRALGIDVLKIGFQPSLIEDAQASESVVGAKVVNLRR